MSELLPVKISITKELRAKASRYAKSQGYTFSGWMGQLIKRELEKEQLKKGQSTDSDNQTMFTKQGD